MKFVYVFFITCLLFSCTSISKEETAKTLIKDHLFKTLPDFKSYESMEFGTIDSFITKLEDDDLYWENVGSLKHYEQKADFYDNAIKINNEYKLKYNDDEANSLKYHRLIDSVKNNLKNISHSFISQFTGWQMDHKFRAKDSKGISKIMNYRLVFNKGIDSVLFEVDRDYKKPDYIPLSIDF